MYLKTLIKAIALQLDNLSSKGGKQWKTALFEENDFNIYSDGDRTTPYMTDKDGCIIVDEIDWQAL